MDATRAIRPNLGEYYRFDDAPIIKESWRKATDCIFVEADELDDKAKRFVVWVKIIRVINQPWLLLLPLQAPTGYSKSINCAIGTHSILHFPNRSPCKESTSTCHLDTHSASSSSCSPVAPRNWFKKVAAMALDAIEDGMETRETKHPLPKTVDLDVQITDNFSPVPEQPVQYFLPVARKFPQDIQGLYLRNGANPLFQPTSVKNVSGEEKSYRGMRKRPWGQSNTFKGDLPRNV
ncbi:hypothetical protein L1887_43597 [Cichorium endivia]|nr:hypothetical protein L1887_43597 [Cichorium endivia]